MQIPASVHAKKLFLQWFLSKFKIKTQEISWFLEDLTEDERSLANLHFVRNIDHCPKGVIISTRANDVPFVFFKGAVQTNDVYTAYHELHLYHEEAFYIQMDFPKKHSHPLYKAVLGEEKAQMEKDRSRAEKLLLHLLDKGKEESLKREINNALDRSDYESFLLHSQKLKEFYKNKG